MKAGALTVAAALALPVSANTHNAARRYAHAQAHAHPNFHERGYTVAGITPLASYPTAGGSGRGRRNGTGYGAGYAPAAEADCDCKVTIYSTFTGEGVLYIPPTPTTYAANLTTAEVHNPTNYPGPVVPISASYAPGTFSHPDVVTTANQTNYVVLCPLTSSPSMIPSSTYAAPVESVSTYEASVFKSSPTYEAPVVKSTSTYEAPVVVPTSSPAKASKPKPSTTPYATPSSGELGTSGKPWAITYSPYQDNGQCKDSGSVASDIAIIAKAGFTAVRVYSSDCSGLENIGSACETHGLKIILGIFISSTGIAGAGEQLTDIVSWGKWNLVELFVVGNEAVFSGHCSAAELASFILTCKTAMTTGGYNGLITTTETLDVWEKNAAVLCPVVDVVGCNIHPFFNAAIDAEHAGEFAASQLKIVDGLCPGKYGVNLETGWPSQGSCNGLACPTLENQATAIKSIVAAVGGKSVMFSYVNDYWKEPGAFGCEQSWGSIQNFLKI